MKFPRQGLSPVCSAGASTLQDWQETAVDAALPPLVQAAAEVATMVDSLVPNEVCAFTAIKN